MAEPGEPKAVSNYSPPICLCEPLGPWPGAKQSRFESTIGGFFVARLSLANLVDGVSAATSPLITLAKKREIASAKPPRNDVKKVDFPLEGAFYPHVFAMANFLRAKQVNRVFPGPPFTFDARGGPDA